MAKIMVMYSTAPPSDLHLAALADLAPGHTIIAARDEETALCHAPETEVALGHRYLRQILPHASDLKWVQSTAGGPHHLLTSDFLRRRPLLTRCPIFSDVIAQHALALLLASLRGIGKTTGPLSPRALPHRAMVFGLGEIGLEVARLLRLNGIAVTGVARVRTPEREAACDEVLTGETWRAQLPRMQVCILCLPATRRTFKVFDASAMDALPAEAIVVNVGHGETLDTAALVERLTQGRLAGAGLDVIGAEFARDRSLDTCPNLLITPKIATFTPQRQDRQERFVEEQFVRYLSGAPLLHQVDLDRALD